MRRYVLAALAVGIAVMLPLLAVIVLPPAAAGISPYVAASAGIALVAASLGLGAGIVAVLAACGTVLLVESVPISGSATRPPQDAFALALFAIDGLVVAGIGSLLHRYRSRHRTSACRAAAESPPAGRPGLHRGRAEPAPQPLSLLVEPLTDREREVLDLLATGRSNAAIADTLCISTNTVKSHLKNVYGKLGVDTRTGALSRAFELGIIPPVPRRPAQARGPRPAADGGGRTEELAA